MEFIIAENINYCSYFKAYMHVKDLSVGDKVIGNDYRNWIIFKHAEFRKKNELRDHVPYSAFQEYKFLDYIRSIELRGF